MHNKLGVNAMQLLCSCSKEYRKFIMNKDIFWRKVNIIFIRDDPRNKYIEDAYIYHDVLSATYANLKHLEILLTNLKHYHFHAPNLQIITLRCGIIGVTSEEIRRFCAKFPKLTTIRITATIQDYFKGQIEAALIYNYKIEYI